MNKKASWSLVIGVPLLLTIFLLNFFEEESSPPGISSNLTDQSFGKSNETSDLSLESFVQASALENDMQVEVMEKDEQAPFFEAETKARLIQIADTFSEDIQYPEYSKPIRNKDELQKYLPNQSVASSLDLDVKKDNSPSISIKSSKLQYFRGEEIIGEAAISNLTNDDIVSVSARLVTSGNIVAETEGRRIGASDTFLVSFEPDSLDVPPKVTELRLIANFNVEGRRYEIGTPVKYVNVVASIDYVADAQVNDTFLEVPVYLTTSQLGYHQISANLYNAETGRALVHLSAYKDVLVEKDFIVLKAHIAALKVAGHEGPYFLDDLTLTRMPSPPRFITEFGTVPDEKITLNGYPFSDYRDEPYIDEQAQERLEFLSKLGGER